MDKKTLIGFGLIGLILVVFSIFNKPDESETTSDETTKDSTKTNITQVDSSSVNSSETDQDSIETPQNNLIAKLDENGAPMTDSLGNPIFTDSATGLDTVIIAPAPANEESSIDKAEEIVTIENEVLKIDISTKGGRIKNVFLKDYLSYDDYVGKNESPLQLIDSASTYGIDFIAKNQKINSADVDFKIVESTESTAKVVMNKGGKKIIYNYALKPGQYDLDFDISFKGFDQNEAKDLHLITSFKMLSTEKHLPNEQREATVYWQYEGESYDYITHDDESLEEEIEWIGFKQAYFTAFIINDNGFDPTDSKVELLDIQDDEQTRYIKEYKADLNLGVSNADNTVELDWYFGPNDYDLLAEYDRGMEDVVSLGIGLFRWINAYAIRPLFTSFISWGMNVWVAILLLTIIVKLLLSPINYKMYKSSAMMKVLKPEMEALNKKYPKKEDAMKKQQELMALYKETGVSPLSGCIPMLIQMPILFAIFRLFPSAIELRQQSFLWAEDLATYDAVVSWSGYVWGLSDIYGNHVSLFTLLMAGTTLLYTHYNSQNMQQPTQEGMPNMKIIMYFFPIMMIFFFNTYSSGLSFYYFISTLMTIIIMWSIKKFMIDDEKILAKIQANRQDPKRKKGKSKFQQRLEEAQKMQQERAKNRKK